jgi:hypothetical protein
MAKMKKIKKADNKFSVLLSISFFPPLRKAIRLKERFFVKLGDKGLAREFHVATRTPETRIKNILVGFSGFAVRRGVNFARFIVIIRGRFMMRLRRVFPGFFFRVLRPHFGESLRISLVVLVCLVLLLNFLAFLYPSFDSKDFVSREPENIDYRIKLIDDLISMNDLQGAKREADFLAGIYPGNEDVEEKMRYVNTLVGRPREIMSQIVFWEEEVRL